MLEIRKSSWHYRLWRLGRENSMSEPKNLCKYFWHLALVKILFPSIAVGFILLGIGALVWVIYGHPLATGVAVLSAVILIAFAVGVVLGIRKLHQRHTERSYERKLVRASMPPKPRKEPSLLWQMIKARKQQMCPLIKVIDE